MSEQNTAPVAPVAAAPVVVEAQPLPPTAPVAAPAPAPAPVLQVVQAPVAAPAPVIQAVVAAVDPQPSLLRKAGAVGAAVGIVGVGCAAGECAAGLIPGVGPVVKIVMRVAGPAIAAPFAAWVARLVRG